MLEHTIILPSELKVLSEESNKGSYEVAGLYPGYGHTLGNALRRIILSSIPGAAITAVKIKGADHEFSTVEGVKEDVITMLLNLKQIRFRAIGEGVHTATVSVKENRLVTAADITTSSDLEVLNPEQRIAEVTDKKHGLEIELTVETGLGFVSKEKLHKEKVDIGTILVDAIFTPIRKVNYEVENMRVGDRTDFNKLIINVETDGTLSPRQTLEEAIKVMLAQLKTVLQLSEQEYNMIAVPKEPESLETGSVSSALETEDSGIDVTDVLKTRIDSVDFSTRTLNALTEANIRTLGGLVQKTEDDLLALDGIGAKGIEEIKSILADNGLALK